MINPVAPLLEDDEISVKSVKFEDDFQVVPSEFGGAGKDYDKRHRVRGKTKADLTKIEGEIFPFQRLDEKKRKMLKKAQQPTCLQIFCFCCFKRSNMIRRRKMPFKTKKMVTVIDMLENLFVKYDEKLVDLLWRKQVFTPLETKKIRDDLSYFMPQIV